MANVLGSEAPIGFFDSGVGGLSIWAEVVKLLPLENTIYLADSANAPYGPRSRDEIVKLSIKNTEFLLNANCKLIVVPCNTATTNAISHLRKNYNVPFVGIEPAIKPAAIKSIEGKIGVLATLGTLTSDLFSATSKKFAGHVQVVEVVGTGLVQLIENGQEESNEIKELLKELCRPFIYAKIDYLVLGCTHYSFIKNALYEIFPYEVTIIDSGAAVARRTQFLLTNLEIPINVGQAYHKLYSNLNTQVLNRFSSGVANRSVEFKTF